jgi:hypothetical protein
VALNDAGSTRIVVGKFSTSRRPLPPLVASTACLLTRGT